MRLKPKDIPAFRDEQAQAQGGRCWLCDINLDTVVACLDHDHSSGRIRGVLCQNCNGIEGKIHNLARRASRGKSVGFYITAILRYWEHHSMYPKDEFHPAHKTADEKRIKRNKQARKRRLKKSA